MNLKRFLLGIVAILFAVSVSARVKTIEVNGNSYLFQYLDNKLAAIHLKSGGEWTTGYFLSYEKGDLKILTCKNWDASNKRYTTWLSNQYVKFDAGHKSLTVRTEPLDTEGKPLMSMLRYFSTVMSSFDGVPTQQYKYTDNGFNNIVNNDEDTKINIKYSDMQLLGNSGGFNYIAFIIENIICDGYPIGLWYPGTEKCFNPIVRIPEKITIKEENETVYYQFSVNPLVVLSHDKMAFEIKKVENGKMQRRFNVVVTFE